MSDNNSIEIKDLKVAYGEIVVLENMNLEIGEGEFLVLLGASGCGKSTLLNCIAGLLDVKDGEIHIKGKNVTWEEPMWWRPLKRRTDKNYPNNRRTFYRTIVNIKENIEMKEFLECRP